MRDRFDGPEQIGTGQVAPRNALRGTSLRKVDVRVQQEIKMVRAKNRGRALQERRRADRDAACQHPRPQLDNQPRPHGRERPAMRSRLSQVVRAS
jgi:hypothetical protein